MANSNSKGARRERELATRLDEMGFEVMRAPSSGSATERELPDVLAGFGPVSYAFEAKASGGDPIYLTEDEVFALGKFAGGFGALPILAVRFDYDDWWFLPPWRCHRTDAGSYRVKQDEAHAHGVPMHALAQGVAAFRDPVRSTA